MPRLNQDERERVEAAEATFNDSFELLKPAWYQVELKEVTIGHGDAGVNWQWVFWQIRDPDDGTYHPGRTWWTTTFTDASIGKLKSTFLAFDAPTDEDTDNLIGEKVLAYIDVETQKKGKRAGQDRNIMTAIKPVDADVSDDEAGSGNKGRDF